jgi:endonuclease I
LKKLLFISFLSLVSVIDTFGQLSSVTQELTFPLTVLKNNVNGSFYIVNHFDSPKTVKVVSLLPVFTPVDTLVTIPANDSAQITVVYRPTQNVTDKSFLAFYTTDSSASYAVVLNGSGSTGDSYQTTTFDKFDAELKTALNGLVVNHISLGYNSARDRMFETIDDLGSDTIECVYTGIKIKAANRTTAQNLGFDTEHTWPQGTFSQAEPMRSDLFHLYPTNSSANNTRSNYNFGVVTSGVTWTVGGSKLGNGTGGIVFEPRDSHKGNVARSMLYFILRYPTNYQSYLNVSQESVFRIWNWSDPVDARELGRNVAITTNQMRRNPLIDHPEFIDRVYSFINNNSASPSSKLNIFPKGVVFDTVYVNDSAFVSMWLINSGNKVLTIANSSISNPVFKFVNMPIQVAANSAVEVLISFKPVAVGNVAGLIDINSDGGSFSGMVKGVSDIGTGIGDDDKTTLTINSFTLKQNYPNPFNPQTKIGFTVPNITGNLSFVKLAVYDVVGNEVALLVNEEKAPGDHQVTFDASNLPGGVYFYRMETTGFTSVKKLVLLK